MQTQQRTNVVLIVVDTLRRDAVGCYGEPPDWPELSRPPSTPNLDRIARQSIRFDRAFPEVLPTLPARRALYTGQRVYPFRNGNFFLKGDFTGAPGWGPIPEDQATLGEMFSAAGYRTGLISDVYHQFKPSKNFWRGYDQWSFVRGQEGDSDRSGPAPTLAQVSRFIPPELVRLREEHKHGEAGEQIPEWAAAFVRNLATRTTEPDWPTVELFTSAVHWLEQNKDAADNGEGVFLTLESFTPHEPWHVPGQYRRLYDESDGSENVMSPYIDIELDAGVLRRTRANYAGSVTFVDHWLGEFFEALESKGWLDNTVVAIVSDHGHSIGDRGYIGKRGYPGVPEVFSVPMLLRLPGAQHAGRVETGWVQHHDLTATLLDLAQVTSPRPLDGHSLLPTLNGTAPPVRDHVVVGWGPDVVVVDEDWWLSIKVNGSGALLYPRGEVSATDARNVADEHLDVVQRLFRLAIDEARGEIPAYILDAADNEADAPGCSPVVARAV